MTKKTTLLLILVALLLTSCGSISQVKQADSSTKELVITAWGNDGNTTQLTVTVANDEALTGSAQWFVWYYDVPDDQVEYVIIDDGYYRLHLHESRNPSQ